MTTTTAAGTKPAPVDDVVFSDLVDQFLGIMTGAENDPCALRSAYDYFVRLPDPNDPEQVQRFFEGAIVLFTSIADAFPPEQSSAAQAVRDRIDEWENETSLADYDPLAFLEFVPSDESLTAMQAFVGNTSAC